MAVTLAAVSAAMLAVNWDATWDAQLAATKELRLAVPSASA